MIEEAMIPHLNEVDWEKDFSDVKKTCLDPNQLTAHLNDVLTNKTLPTKDKKKLNPNMPHVHAGAIPTDESDNIDVPAFIKNITQMPPQILSGNVKMQKSSNDSSMSINIGIPALRGLVYDINGKQFYVINTCPGAGSCVFVCYAMKGSYIMFPDVFVKQTRILNLLLNFPEKFKQILLRELEIICMKNEGKEIVFRWNDAGDFFGKKYFEIAREITNELTAAGYNFKSYGYTKVGDVVNKEKPENFVINFSDDANKRETKKVDTANTKKSVIVPKEIFSDLLKRDATGRNYAKNAKGKILFSKPTSLDELKNRLSKQYGVDKNSIITYDQMLSIPPNSGKQYNVIVMPSGDGDVSAQRNDVMTTFLLFH